MNTILLVDDAAFMRMMLKNIIDKIDGFEVISEASDGREAIEKYTELFPDIVLMDITMPEMEGTEAVKKICSIDENAKIIMVSAMGQQPIVIKAIKAGAKNFIVKPFREDKIKNALEQVIK